MASRHLRRLSAVPRRRRPGRAQARRAGARAATCVRISRSTCRRDRPPPSPRRDQRASRALARVVRASVCRDLRAPSRCSRIVSVVIEGSCSSAIVSRSTRAKARNAATRLVEPVVGESERRAARRISPAPSENRNSGIGSGASSAAWMISGSAAGCSLAASSMASAKVFVDRQLDRDTRPARRVSASSSLSRRRREAAAILGQRRSQSRSQ